MLTIFCSHSRCLTWAVITLFWTLNRIVTLDEATSAKTAPLSHSENLTALTIFALYTYVDRKLRVFSISVNLCLPSLMLASADLVNSHSVWPGLHKNKGVGYFLCSMLASKGPST